MASKKILLLGEYIGKEGIANATITPGMLIERMSTGKLRAHATAGANAQKLFARENDLSGGTINTNYAADSRVLAMIPERGAEVYAILHDGENVAIGDALVSAGNGKLKKYVAEVDLNHAGSADFTVHTDQIVAYAMEAVNLSGSSDADPSDRIIVEIA